MAFSNACASRRSTVSSPSVDPLHASTSVRLAAVLPPDATNAHGRSELERSRTLPACDLDRLHQALFRGAGAAQCMTRDERRPLAVLPAPKQLTLLPIELGFVEASRARKHAASARPGGA